MVRCRVEDDLTHVGFDVDDVAGPVGQQSFERLLHEVVWIDLFGRDRCCEAT